MICEWLALNLLPAVPREINLVDILNFNQSHVCPKLVIQYPPLTASHILLAFTGIWVWFFPKIPRLSSHSLQNDMDLFQLTKTISRLQKWQSKQLLFCIVLFQILKQMQNPAANQKESEGEFGWPQNFVHFVMFWPNRRYCQGYGHWVI